MKTPILLDTDIGTDIDDAYALILAAESPELDLRAVTTVNNDVLTRAQIAKRILQLLGRPDIPIALGESRSLTPGESRGWLGIEGQGIDLSGIDPDRDFAPYDAPKMIAGCCRHAAESGSLLTIVTIGAMTNLATAMDRYPDRLRQAHRIIAMASTFEGFGPENARPEHNVACDPLAVDRILRFGLPITFVGLNVTRQTQMTVKDLEQIEQIGGPLADSLSGMHRVWFNHIGRDLSPMHDALAVAALIQPDILELLPVTPTVHVESAAVEFNPRSPTEVTTCWAAVAVDTDRFHDLLFMRVESAVQYATANPLSPSE